MKVIFDFARRQIGIEGDAPELVDVLQLARQIAPSLSEIKILTDANRSPSMQQPSTVSPQNNGNHLENGDDHVPDKPPVMAGTTLRQFARSLQLANASERIAAIAYYQKVHENRDSFSPKELSEWFTICGFKKPSQMPVALFDSRRKFGYTESSSRGVWKLTTNGENLIIGKLNRTNSD